MDAYGILVIILSTLLAIVLTMAVIAGMFIVKITKDVRHITAKAALAVDNIEEAALTLKNTSSVVAFIRMAANAVETVMQKNKKGEKHDE